MIPVDQLFNQGEYRFIPDVDSASVKFNGDNVKTTKAPDVKKVEEKKVKIPADAKKLDDTRKFDENEPLKPTLNDLFTSDGNKMTANEANNELRQEFEEFLMTKYSNLAENDNEAEFEARHLKTLKLPAFSFASSLDKAQKNINALVESSVNKLNARIEAMNARIEAALERFTNTLTSFLPLPTIPKPKEFLVEEYYKPKDKETTKKPPTTSKTTTTPPKLSTKKVEKHTTKDSWYDDDNWETTFKPYSKKTSPKYEEQYYKSTTDQSIQSSYYYTPPTIQYYRSDSESAPSEKVVEKVVKVTKEKINEIVESVKSILDEKENATSKGTQKADLLKMEDDPVLDVRGPQNLENTIDESQNLKAPEKKDLQLDDDAPRSDIRVTLEDIENMDSELEDNENFDEGN